MLRLHHFPLCPYSRKIRLLLREKGLRFEEVEVEPWKQIDVLFELNPALEVPVLQDEDLTVCDSRAIADFLEESKPEHNFLGTSLERRNETRRLVAWFDDKFAREVTDLLWREKLIKRLKRIGTPNSDNMRAGAANLKAHLAYLSELFSDRRWLAGDDLTLADMAAAAHLSVLDYLGDVPWQNFPLAKEWYGKMKSRPSFRPLLADRLPAMKPPLHYDDLDF
jgi:glutathione S-transferase